MYSSRCVKNVLCVTDIHKKCDLLLASVGGSTLATRKFGKFLSRVSSKFLTAICLSDAGRRDRKLKWRFDHFWKCGNTLVILDVG